MLTDIGAVGTTVVVCGWLVLSYNSFSACFAGLMKTLGFCPNIRIFVLEIYSIM